MRHTSSQQSWLLMNASKFASYSEMPGFEGELELPRLAIRKQLRVARRLPARRPGLITKLQPVEPFDVKVAGWRPTPLSLSLRADADTARLQSHHGPGVEAATAESRRSRSRPTVRKAGSQHSSICRCCRRRRRAFRWIGTGTASPPKSSAVR